LSHIAIYLKVVGLLLTEFLHGRGEESPEVDARRSKIPHAASVHTAAAGVSFAGSNRNKGPLDFFFFQALECTYFSENKHIFVVHFICFE
jgi:hypothetical protein